MKTIKKSTLAKKPVPKKRLWIKWAVGGAFALALGVGAAVVLSSRKPEEESKSEPEQETSTPKPKTTTVTKPAKKWKGNGFPLQMRSNGFRVTALQNALVKKHGNVLPKYGADGYWGSELLSALLAAGWPAYYSSATFARIVGEGSPSSTQGSISNFHDAAWNLHRASKARDWSAASAILSKMRSVGDYLAIRSSFITWPFRGSANFTPVNALLWAFPSRRSEIEGHLTRMGLSKQSGGKWSTSGLSGLPSLRRRIRTTKTAMIWTPENLGIRMPADMLLGEEVRSGGGFTEFVNGNGQPFFVHSADVTYA